jgi:hypothetical protein
MRGTRTSLKIAVHSLWSGEARSLERRVRWREAKACWRRERQGFRHWWARVLRIGDQYAVHAVVVCVS